MWIYGNWWNMKESSKLFEHLCGASVKRLHAVDIKLLSFFKDPIKIQFYPILVMSFPWTCKNEIIKRLLSSDASILSSSPSSLLSALFPSMVQSNGPVLWTRLPPSGWIHVSFLRFPSNLCSFSFNRNRFFSSRLRCENSYWRWNNFHKLLNYAYKSLPFIWIWPYKAFIQQR